VGTGGPLVSVIIPAYNAGEFIDATLQSVFAQTHQDFDVIVVDDGSTDTTRARVRAYGDRVRYIHQMNAGVGAARNRGLDAATGDYVAFLDADDLWRPEKLEIQLKVAARSPSSGLIACDGRRFLSGGDPMPGHLLSRWVVERLAGCDGGSLVGRFYREALQSNPITSPSQMLIPRPVTREIGPMITGRNTAEDWDYTLRIAQRYPITMHADSLVLYRMHDQSRSGRPDRRQFVWAAWDLELLTRHEALCPPEERGFLQRIRRETVRAFAYEAYCHGRRRDARGARRFLWWLLRQALTEPRVAGALLASWIPERALEQILAVVRQGRAALRQARRTTP
jgi:glycosyltransferase involved in cell wall biosynthesis